MADALKKDKAELRRRQVLDAAAECFRREGFHGSSIVRISQAAGMSPGHIYHYFANKEAIVAAIAARERDNLTDLVERVEEDAAGGTLVERLSRHTAERAIQSSDPAAAGLMIELTAEAIRNPVIAAILRDSDQAISARFLSLARQMGALPDTPDAEVVLRGAMIAAIMQGLAMRSVVEPERPQEPTVRLLNKIISVLLEDA